MDENVAGLESMPRVDVNAVLTTEREALLQILSGLDGGEWRKRLRPGGRHLSRHPRIARFSSVRRCVFDAATNTTLSFLLSSGTYTNPMFIAGFGNSESVGNGAIRMAARTISGPITLMSDAATANGTITGIISGPGGLIVGAGSGNEHG